MDRCFPFLPIHLVLNGGKSHWLFLVVRVLAFRVLAFRVLVFQTPQEKTIVPNTGQVIGIKQSTRHRGV